VVYGSRLLLICGLLGCKAELLGVELPRGGRDAISPEDLQRDTWMIARIPDRARDAEAVAQGVSTRFQQMHTRPGYGRSYVDAAGDSRIVCAEKDGQSEHRVLIVAEDTGESTAGGAAPVAALVSILKGFDTPALPPRGVIACALIGAGARARFLQQPPLPLDGLDIRLIGPLGVGTPHEAPTTLGDHPARQHALGEIPEPDAMESLDYRTLQEAVVALFDAVAAPVTP
jgi:hypothetical protein